MRNRLDGSVEILALGPEPDIQALIDACREGPEAAHVTSVERANGEDDGVAGFDSRATA